jgi:hypothetical protein
MQNLFRKSLSLGAVALIAATLALPASAGDMAKNPCGAPGNPCATKPANPCAEKSGNPCAKPAKKMKKAKKAANPCAQNPCAKQANPDAKK